MKIKFKSCHPENGMKLVRRNIVWDEKDQTCKVKTFSFNGSGLELNILLFTGVCTGTGVEVYDGDKGYDESGREFEIFYWDDRAGFYVKWKDAIHPYPFTKEIASSFTITGNIYEV